MKTKKTPTQKKYSSWKTTKYVLKASTYVVPLVPEGIILGINWNEWFTVSNSWSIGLGFGSLLVTIMVTILGIAKRDDVVKENISPMFYLAGLMAMWAVSLMFLASIAQNFGTMLLYTAAGICGGATCDQINKTVVAEKVKMYKEILVEVGLDKENNKLEELKEQALKEAKKEKRALDNGTQI